MFGWGNDTQLLNQIFLEVLFSLSIYSANYYECKS